MTESNTQPSSCQEKSAGHHDTVRLLVVIASYGSKNLDLLKKVIGEYRKMPFRADIVVVSNTPKNLGEGVEVVVGLPTRDPWSLPFAHKAVLAIKADNYDLFAYSEDDMVVTEKSIRAFLRVTPLLAQDEIAGFLRYEIDASGSISLPDVQYCYHWKPDSVKRRAGILTAEFTNEHAGFYLLTRAQLKMAIASGGFLRAPCSSGRYGMLETAATDPYTICGFRKVICLSDLDAFLIHHASNRYVGELGLPLAELKIQIQALAEICDGSRPAITLCQVEPKVLVGHWAKNLYEKLDTRWVEAVPKQARTVLSIGCGWGLTEAEWQKRGLAITALASDSVSGVLAEQRGIHPIYATLDEGFKMLRGRQFDCVVLRHLIHLFPDPARLIAACSSLLRPGGVLLLSAPNFNRFEVLFRRMRFKAQYREMSSFAKSSINLSGPRALSKILKQAGFRAIEFHWVNHRALLRNWPQPPRRLGCLTAADWMMAATRGAASDPVTTPLKALEGKRL